MFDSENKLSLFKLISIFLIATLASIALTSFVSGILLSMNSYFGADVTDVLPVKSGGKYIFSWWSSFILNPDGFNIAVVALISIVLFAVSLVLIFLVLKDYKADAVKIGLVLVIIFVFPSLVLVIKELDFLDVILLHYMDDYNALFHLILMVMIFPSWIILGVSYILLNKSNLVWKVLICVIYCLPIYYFNLDFYNSLYISTERYDLRREITSINPVKLNSEINNRYYILIKSSGEVLIDKYKSDYIGLPLSEHNFVVLNNYILNNPESALLKDITGFIQQYSFINYDPVIYRDYLVQMYQKNPNSYISVQLISFFKSYSHPGKSLDIIENKIINLKDSSKIAYGFLAALYEKIGQEEKSNVFWKKYTNSDEKDYISTYIKSWIDNRSKQSNKNIEVKATLLINGSEAQEIKLMMVEKNKFGLYHKVIDDTETDKSGKFSLITNNCSNFALMVDLPLDFNLKKVSSIPKLSMGDCKSNVDLGIINLKSLD